MWLTGRRSRAGRKCNTIEDSGNIAQGGLASKKYINILTAQVGYLSRNHKMREEKREMGDGRWEMGDGRWEMACPRPLPGVSRDSAGG